MFAACLAALALNPATLAFVERSTVSTRYVVVDPAGRPIAGAELHANMSSGKHITNVNVETAVDGSAVVRRPADATCVRLWVSADGYAGLFRGWEPEAKALPPAEFRVPMPKAVTIGGRVVDAAGKPISGAMVEARCDVPKSQLPDQLAYNSYLAYEDGSPLTDADGRWALNNVPPGATKFSLRVTHPGYLGDARYGEVQAAAGVTDAQLLASSAVMTLGNGAKLTGTITDEAGKPVPDAVVVFHDDPAMTPGTWEVKSDADGRYSLPALRPGRHPVTVVARGRRPEKKQIILKEGTQTEDFRLYPGVPLILKFVDEDGKPVPDVTVLINRWRGGESLYNKTINVTPQRVPSRTGKDGIFRWSWAPDDPVDYYILARDMQMKSLAVVADGSEQTVVLRPVPTVTGRVTDASTGKPVSRFRVTPVDDFGKELLNVDRQFTKLFESSNYTLSYDRDDTDFRIYIEADGYRTAVSRANLAKDRVKVVDFALVPAPPVAGRVVDAAGQPLLGAKVFLATKVQQTRFPDDFNGLVATSAADGTFALPAQSIPYTLIADHASGFTMSDRGPDDPAGDLKLAPWAAVEGTVWQDGEPVDGQRAWLTSRGEVVRPSGATVRLSFGERTHDGGRFRFGRVPPGEYSLSAYLGFAEYSPLTGAEQRMVAAASGETTAVELGKGGATVSGRFKLAGKNPTGVTFEFTLAVLVRKKPDAPPGLDLSKGYDRKRIDGTPGERELLRRHRQFAVKPTPEGEFRVNGVPAGDYWLVARVFEPPQGTCLTTAMGSSLTPVMVTPEQAAGKQSVEVPPVTVAVEPGPQLGDRFPALALTDTGGRPIDLAKSEGTPVLLHAWAGWCVNCPRDYAAIRKLRADLPEGKLRVVGLNFDDSAAAAAKLATKYEFAWEQACLGTTAGKAAADALAVGGIPCYFALDAGGRVAYRGTSLGEAEKTLRALVE